MCKNKSTLWRVSYYIAARCETDDLYFFLSLLKRNLLTGQNKTMTYYGAIFFTGAFVCIIHNI